MWLCGKLIGQRKYFFEPATVFSLWGIALGVAFLIVSMSCFSGFTKALQKSIVDISGDIIIFKKGGVDEGFHLGSPTNKRFQLSN